MSGLEQQIEAIDRALAENRYKPGAWQRLITAVETLPRAERRSLETRLSALSDRLHGRHGFPRLPFALAYAIEWGLLLGGILLVLNGRDSLLLSGAGVVALLLCMQPFVKVTTGLVLGVRYSYAYLWYIEPRFKMSYGTYLVLEPRGRVILQLAGSVGTPLAAWLGYLLVDPSLELVTAGCFWLFLGMVVLQVASFLAEWFGIRKVGPFRLSLLTSPATAAAEMRKPNRG